MPNDKYTSIVNLDFQYAHRFMNSKTPSTRRRASPTPARTGSRRPGKCVTTSTTPRCSRKATRS